MIRLHHPSTSGIMYHPPPHRCGTESWRRYPATMRYTYAIAGLKDKRARLAGEIESRDRATAKLREQLAAIDATLRLFHPEADPNHITPIRPKWRGVYFRNGERTRLCLEALRDAGAPLRQGGIAEYVMRAKGMDPADRPLRAVIVNNVGVSLARLAKNGKIRRLVSEPEAWWELAL
jgi:hypothetical protein